MVCFVVGGIGGVLWYPVWGLMGLRFGGYVLELYVVLAEVGDLEGWQVRCALVYCLVVGLTISVLVPVALLIHDVELDIGRRLRRAFQSSSAWMPRLVAVALWSGCLAMRRSRCVSTVASATNQTRTMCGR